MSINMKQKWIATAAPLFECNLPSLCKYFVNIYLICFNNFCLEAQIHIVPYLSGV